MKMHSTAYGAYFILMLVTGCGAKL